jgi:hypothetical protein
LFPSSPAGLRLETGLKIDKKKMNFIFHRREKIFLTRKPKRACPRKKRKWSLWQISPRRFAAPISDRRGELLGIVASFGVLPS